MRLKLKDFNMIWDVKSTISSDYNCPNFIKKIVSLDIYNSNYFLLMQYFPHFTLFIYRNNVCIYTCTLR